MLKFMVDMYNWLNIQFWLNMLLFINICKNMIDIGFGEIYINIFDSFFNLEVYIYV